MIISPTSPHLATWDSSSQSALDSNLVQTILDSDFDKATELLKSGADTSKVLDTKIENYSLDLAKNFENGPLSSIFQFGFSICIDDEELFEESKQLIFREISNSLDALTPKDQSITLFEYAFNSGQIEFIASAIHLNPSLLEKFKSICSDAPALFFSTLGHNSENVNSLSHLLETEILDCLTKKQATILELFTLWTLAKNGNSHLLIKALEGLEKKAPLTYLGMDEEIPFEQLLTGLVMLGIQHSQFSTVKQLVQTFNINLAKDTEPLEELLAEGTYPKDNVIEALNLVRELGADIYFENENGENALSYAIQSNNPQVVAYLLDLGFDLNQVDHEGNPLFTLACKHCDLKMINYLISLGLNTDVEYKYLHDPLRGAAQYNTVEVIDFLLLEGFQKYSRTDYALLKDIVNNSNVTPEMLQHYIDQGFKIRSDDEEGNLIYSLCHHNLQRRDKKNIQDTIRFLVSLGLCDEQPGSLKHIPHQLASYNANVDIIELLLDQGIDVNAINDVWEQNALFSAAQYLALDVVKLLVSRGIDVDTKDRFNKTALDYLKDDDFVTYLDEAETRVMQEIADLIASLNNQKGNDLAASLDEPNTKMTKEIADFIASLKHQNDNDLAALLDKIATSMSKEIDYFEEIKLIP